MSADERNKGQSESSRLLRDAERLKRTVEATEAEIKRTHKKTAAASVGRHVTSMHDAGVRAWAGASWLWSNVLVPIATHRWVGAVFRWYGRQWRKFVYRRDADGDPQFSKARASAMVVGTAVALWYLPAFIFGTIGFVWDSVWMATTYRSNETWYLGKSQELDYVNNVFSAQGCASVNCSDQTSIYFRIEPSLAHHLWSLVRNRNIFFPDFVAAGIQNDVNKCQVIAYGARWKFLVRNWDMYPQILAVDCIPVTEGEIEAIERALRVPAEGNAVNSR
jgi:hypothetical protein